MGAGAVISGGPESRHRLYLLVYDDILNNPDNVNSLWSCLHCVRDGSGLVIYDISHVTHCPKYQHLKEGKDLVNSDADLVQHFREVIKLRDIDSD